MGFLCFGASKSGRGCVLSALIVLVTTAAQAQSGQAKLPPALLDKIELEGTAYVIARISPDEGASDGLALSRASPRVRARMRRLRLRRAQEQVAARMRSHHDDATLYFENIPFIALEVDARDLARLEASPEVVAIEEDKLLRPLLDQSVALVGGDRAWDDGYSGVGHAVAILDTGVDGSHPALRGKVVAEACFSSAGIESTSLCPNGTNPGGRDSEIGDGAARPCTLSGCDHGTHAAGIAAGDDRNYAGVARDAEIIAVQVFSSYQSASVCGGPDVCPLARMSDIIDGLEHIYNLRDEYDIAAVNLSLGGGAYTSQSSCDADNGAIKAVIDNLRRAGIATVVASGNEGRGDAMTAPACISSAVSVGSTSLDDDVLVSSNTASWLTLLAPGLAITSAVPGGGFESKSGTSMSSPHVAGAIAVLRSFAADTSVERMVSVLRETGVSVLDPANGHRFRRLQVDEALARLDAAQPPPEDPAPLELTTTSLPVATLGERYSQTVTASGGVAPYSFRVSRGTPAAGLTMHANGELSGIATRVSSKTLTFEVRDARGRFVRRDIVLTVRPVTAGAALGPPSITTDTLPAGVANSSYRVSLDASGGVAPYTWRVSQGRLPAGITLDASRGLLSGVASAGGERTVTFEAKDSRGRFGRRRLTLSIDSPAT